MRLLIENARAHAKKSKTLQNVLRDLRCARIVAIGCGAGGNTFIGRLMAIGVEGAECVAIDMDRQNLESVKALRRIFIERIMTKDLGTSAFPEIGAVSTEEYRKELAELLRDTDVVFVATGLDGDFGTGIASIVAEIAKETDDLVIGVVTTPSETEREWDEKTKEGVSKLLRHADSVIVINNNKVREIVPHFTTDEVLSLTDEILAHVVKVITETITLRNLFFIDYADIRTIMADGGGLAMVGIGESDKENRAEDAASFALSCQFTELDIKSATATLIDVCGGPDMTLEGAHKVAKIVVNKLASDAKLIWVVRVDESAQGMIRVTLVITGIQRPQEAT